MPIGVNLTFRPLPYVDLTPPPTPPRARGELGAPSGD